jgi:hypothetical protein
MFQKARVPSWKRAFWPIVTTGSKILWARDFGPAAEGGFRAVESGPEGAGIGLDGDRDAWLRVWEKFPAGQ